MGVKQYFGASAVFWGFSIVLVIKQYFGAKAVDLFWSLSRILVLKLKKLGPVYSEPTTSSLPMDNHYPPVSN